MKLKIFLEWTPWGRNPYRRKERLEIHAFEDFMWRPSITRQEYLKELGWLGFWVTYEGKFFKLNCFGPWSW